MGDTMDISKYSRKQLLILPSKPWSKISEYDSVIIFGSRVKHDSGFNLINVIGCIDQNPVEIATQCSDDINWFVSKSNHSGVANLRMDVLPKSNATHFWRRESKFVVGSAHSSFDIKVEYK